MQRLICTSNLLLLCTCNCWFVHATADHTVITVHLGLHAFNTQAKAGLGDMLAVRACVIYCGCSPLKLISILQQDFSLGGFVHL